MNIKKATITALALFAAAATSHGSRLAPSSSYYGDSEDEQEVADGKNDAGDAEAEEREPIDLSQLEAGDTLSFSFEDDFPEEINGYEVLSSFLPEGVSLEWTGKKLKAPQDYTDVRGLVVADYQEELEKAWVAELRKKYPVTVNKDVLATVNKH